MEKPKNKILSDWRSYSYHKAAALLKQKSGEDKIPKKILLAMVLWEFILDLRRDYIDQEDIKPFLTELFVSSDDQYVRLVLMIESLPTAVWRKLLWRHNIDFVSFPSFLRRITPKQMQAITDNFNDISCGLEARILKPKEKGLPLSSICAFTNVRRYVNKGSMAYNLLNLDFGFNAYPEGVHSDKKVEEVNPFKFFSVKTRDDNFVVNREDSGKYWQLYKSARSNYVYRPKRDVEFKNNICPGFWWTLIVHLLFWIISPAALVVSGTLIVSNSFEPTLVSMSFAAIGSLTLLWSIIALIKIPFSLLAKVLPRFDKEIKLLFLSCALGFLTILVLILCFFFSGFTFADTSISVVRCILLLASISLVVFKTDNDEWELNPKESNKKLALIPLGVSVVLYTIEFFQPISHVVWTCLVWLGNLFITTFGYMMVFVEFWGLAVLLFVLAVLFPIALLLVTDKYSDYRKYPKLAYWVSDILPKYLIYFFSLTVLAAFVLLLQGSVNVQNETNAIIFSVTVAWLLICLTAALIVKATSYKHDYKIKELMKIRTERMDNFKYWEEEWQRRYALRIKNNSFLRSLTEEELKKVLNLFLDSIIFRRFRWKKEVVFFLFLDYANENMVKELNGIPEDIWRDLDKDDFLKFFILLEKMEAEEVIKKIEQEKETINKIENMLIGLGRFLSWPFRLVAKGFRKLWEYVYTIKGLEKYLRERCPLVFPSKDLLA